MSALQMYIIVIIPFFFLSYSFIPFSAPVPLTRKPPTKTNSSGETAKQRTHLVALEKHCLHSILIYIPDGVWKHATNATAGIKQLMSQLCTKLDGRFNNRVISIELTPSLPPFPPSAPFPHCSSVALLALARRYGTADAEIKVPSAEYS